MLRWILLQDGAMSIFSCGISCVRTIRELPLRGRYKVPHSLARENDHIIFLPGVRKSIIFSLRWWAGIRGGGIDKGFHPHPALSRRGRREWNVVRGFSLAWATLKGRATLVRWITYCLKVEMLTYSWIKIANLLQWIYVIAGSCIRFSTSGKYLLAIDN